MQHRNDDSSFAQSKPLEREGRRATRLKLKSHACRAAKGNIYDGSFYQPFFNEMKRYVETLIPAGIDNPLRRILDDGAFAFPLESRGAEHDDLHHHLDQYESFQ